MRHRPSSFAYFTRAVVITLVLPILCFAQDDPTAANKKRLRLKDNPGVQPASVDYDQGEATVGTNPTTPESLESLKNAVEKVGYRVALKETSSTAGFGGELVQSDKKQTGQLPSVTFRVIGMKKTKSGAT